MIKVAFINVYGQTGLTHQKLFEIENFIQKHRLEIICLQETNVSEDTFLECNYIYKNFYITPNNSKSGYGTCTLVKKNFTVTNIIKDSDGRFISMDIDEKLTVVNIYLPSGTDQKTKTERESIIDNLPNLLLYKKESGIIGGDFNCITDKQDALLHPDQKMSKCLKKLIKLYDLSDAFRNLFPMQKQFSRYYVWKGATGATRIDRCYSWGNFKSRDAAYHALSFSDHLAHVVSFQSPSELYQKENPRKRSIYKIKHWLVKDATFQERIRSEFEHWMEMKEHFSAIYFWEEVVKPGIRKVAIQREREINQEKMQELQALQLKLDFYLSELKNSDSKNYSERLSNYDLAKKNLNDFYQKRAKVILYQNRSEIFEMSDATKIYHFESLSNYIKQSTIDKIEVGNQIYEKKEDVEGAINSALQESMSKSHSIDSSAFNDLFSFDVPQISQSDNMLLTQEINRSELRKALLKLRSKAAPGLDSIPSGLYVTMFSLFAPLMLEVFNEIINGQTPAASMRTSIVQYLNKPKKANSVKLSDKRKISILCTDFKCLEKILANRLKRVMSKFISQSQYAIKPRKISHAVSAARDLINVATKNNIPMGFLSLDMEAAFDNLNMEYVYLCLARYGFSKSAIDIFKNIYSEAMAMSYINGSMSKLILDQAGNLRQGGCGSMELFVVGVNPLVQLLEKKLRGVVLYSAPIIGPVRKYETNLAPFEKTGKLVGYVDDICPVVTSKEEFFIVDKCLRLFEFSSGCMFHRNPTTQKCKITLYGSWKRKYNQENIPLSFLKISDHLDILGIKLFETWRKTQRENGSKLVSKVKLVADRWKGGRFYSFLLRPHIVNTYLFSNIWYTAGVMDLQLGHLDEIQKKGNHYVHSDCFLKPQNVVNYMPKSQMGLGLMNVRAKSLALFIKNILSEAYSGSNCYLSSVLDYYCQDMELEPVPVRPDYMTEGLINKIKLVLQSCSSLNTKSIYRVLLYEHLNIGEDFKLKVETDNPDLNKENAVSLVTSKLLSVNARNIVWKYFHNVIHDDLREGKIKNVLPICKLCLEAGIDRVHIYYTCVKYKGCGKRLVEVMRTFGQYICEDDLVNLVIGDSTSASMWLAANYLYFVTEYRENCSPQKFQQFLHQEFEIFKKSKFCDENLISSLMMMINLFGN